MNGPTVSVVIPTWNAGPDFTAVISRIQAQQLDRPAELIIIDSGSSDGTRERARDVDRSLRLIEIQHAEFNHGSTRQLGVREARGEVVVFLAQDALPADNQWLQALLDCFADPKVAGAYSRQLPRTDANPFIRTRLEQWMPQGRLRRIQRIGEKAAFDRLPHGARIDTVAFDNVSAGVRRSVALGIPFQACRFGEDIDWSTRVLLAGYDIVYEPRSCVVHSHDHSNWYELKRAYLDHQNRERLVGTNAPASLAQLAATIFTDAKHYMKVAASDSRLGLPARTRWLLNALPFAVTQNLGQFLGARSVDRLAHGSIAYRKIDRWLSGGV